MFKINQIISKTQLIKRFELVARHLESYPQALLITRKRGGHLVLVNAEIWEGFLLERLEKDLEKGEPSFLGREIRAAELKI